MSYEPKTYKVIAICIGKPSSSADLLYKVFYEDKEICYRTHYPLKEAAETLRGWRFKADMEDIITLQHGDDEKSPITIKTTIEYALGIRNFSRDLAMAAGKNRS